jgi:hypothetical protein
MMLRTSIAATALLAAHATGQNFTVSNGQIFTPGFAILDAPQPGTPEGGGAIIRLEYASLPCHRADRL